VRRNQVGNRQVGDHITIGDNKRVVDASGLCGKADSSAGVERFGLDGICEVDIAAFPFGECFHEGLGLETQRKYHVGDSAPREAVNQQCDHRAMPDWQHWFRRMICQRSKPRPKPTDENDGAHQPSEVTGTLV
jgi:hypothetical protein